MEIMTTEGCDEFRNDTCVRNCCNTRAEKAFKSGQKLSLEKQGLAYLEGKQAGIKEIIDWVNSKDHPANISHIHIVKSDWQAKLKEVAHDQEA